MGSVRAGLGLLLLSSLWGLDCGQQLDACQNCRHQFERVFSVPGDVALLLPTLLSPPSCVFNLSAEPYNVTWYRPPSERPISSQSGRVLVRGEALWLLNVSEADAGDYEALVRTAQQCFRLQSRLVVDLPRPPCGRPKTVVQGLIKGVTDQLSCPLQNHINKLRSYGLPHNISWYKGCELISDGLSRFHYWASSLKVEGVESADEGLYTCTLHFSLGGAKGSVSETIQAEVQGDYYQRPQIREPAKDVVRAELGSKVAKRCLVFVPTEGRPLLDVDVYWLKDISDDPTHRVYMTQERTEIQDGGVLIERWLIISELKEEDLNVSYTCQVLSSHGCPTCYFTVLPKDPDLLVPVSLLIGCCLLLFLLFVSGFYVFKVELVLCFRRTFPMLYTTSDGKLYDAYVAYPQSCSPGWTEEVERFALHTLPRVLEEACGYSLFIPERDALPGQAVMESVEENLKSCRRIILLYTASTFSDKYCSSNNNNTLLSPPWDPTDTEPRGHTGYREHLSIYEEHPDTGKDHLDTDHDRLHSNGDHLNIDTSKSDLKTTKEDQVISNNILNICKDRLNSSKHGLIANDTKKELSKSNKGHINISKDLSNSNNGHLNISNDHLDAKDLLNTEVHLTSCKELLTCRRFPSCPSEDLHSEGPQMCEQRCGLERTQLECVIAMHRALLERSLKVILVELEELGPSELQQLPESVRHLRQSQGAVSWWRSPGTRWRTGGDPDTALSPHCRFWKEVRYRMPARAERRGPAETAALLQRQRTQTLHSIPV